MIIITMVFVVVVVPQHFKSDTFFILSSGVSKPFAILKSLTHPEELVSCNSASLSFSAGTKCQVLLWITDSVPSDTSVIFLLLSLSDSYSSHKVQLKCCSFFVAFSDSPFLCVLFSPLHTCFPFPLNYDTEAVCLHYITSYHLSFCLSLLKFYNKIQTGWLIQQTSISHSSGDWDIPPSVGRQIQLVVRGLFLACRGLPSHSVITQ